MDFLSQFLPIIIYILLIGLIIIGIIIGIKLIITMNKVEKLVVNVEEKVNSLNEIFTIIQTTSGKITGVYSKVVEVCTSLVDKIFFRKGKDNDYE